MYCKFNVEVTMKTKNNYLCSLVGAFLFCTFLVFSGDLIAGDKSKPVECELKVKRVIGEKYYEDEKAGILQIVDVDTDSKGNIYVLDAGRNKVMKYDRNGDFVKSWGTKGNGPGAFYLKAGYLNQKLYVSNEDEVYIYTRSRLQVFTPDGEYKRSIRTRLLQFSTDNKRNIYKAASCIDASCKNVEVLGADGTRRRKFGKLMLSSTIFSASDISGHSFFLTGTRFVSVTDNNVYVSYEGFPFVQYYNPEGKLIWEKSIDFNKIKIIPEKEKKLLEEKLSVLTDRINDVDDIPEKNRSYVLDSETFMGNLYLFFSPGRYLIVEMNQSGMLVGAYDLMPMVKSLNLEGLINFTIDKSTGNLLIFTLNGSLIIETKKCSKEER